MIKLPSCRDFSISSLSAVLRSYGHTKETMFVTVIMNIISIIGYFIAIKGWFGIPVSGVFGVSVSIIIAKEGFSSDGANVEKSDDLFAFSNTSSIVLSTDS
jgi:hypothetical protein